MIVIPKRANPKQARERHEDDSSEKHCGNNWNKHDKGSQGACVVIAVLASCYHNEAHNEKCLHIEWFVGATHDCAVCVVR